MSLAYDITAAYDASSTQSSVMIYIISAISASTHFFEVIVLSTLCSSKLH